MTFCTDEWVFSQLFLNKCVLFSRNKILVTPISQSSCNLNVHPCTFNPHSKDNRALHILWRIGGELGNLAFKETIARLERKLKEQCLQCRVIVPLALPMRGGWTVRGPKEKLWYCSKIYHQHNMAYMEDNNFQYSSTSFRYDTLENL